MNQEFITAIDQIAKSKGINKEKLVEAIKQSIVVACKKHFGIGAGVKQNLKINIDEIKGDVKVFTSKKVVADEDVMSPLVEIGITEAPIFSPP